MSKVGWALLFGAVLASMALAACGGSGGGEASGQTKARFVKQASEKCTAAKESKFATIQAELARRAKGGKPLTRAAEEALVTKDILPTLALMAEELGSLELPAGEEEQAGAVLAAYERAVRQIKADPSKEMSGNSPVIKADEMAEEYGIAACEGL